MSEHRSRLCVYCGSAAGADPRYATAAGELGRALAERSIGLVYGGGSVGLMGVVADAALEAGGEVTGVITRQLLDAEVAHRGLTSLEVVESMHERKARMSELADGFLVLPGGFGTVDEFAEMLTWNQLGIVTKPVVLVDVFEYWSTFVEWVDRAAAAGFVRAAHRPLVQCTADIGAAVDLAMSPLAPPPAKWLDATRTARYQPPEP